MKIMRIGKTFEVFNDYSDVVFVGDTYEQARNYLANAGVDDAAGELSRGNVDLFGVYDLRENSRLRNKRKTVSARSRKKD